MKIDFDKVELETIKDAIEFSLIERKDEWLYEQDAQIIITIIEEELNP